ncbi:hypothetical protein MMC25_005559 [Agyrium rufum]|nr:hypothetical protein [Agyrium rufum]
MSYLPPNRTPRQPNLPSPHPQPQSNAHSTTTNQATAPSPYNPTASRPAPQAPSSSIAVGGLNNVPQQQQVQTPRSVPSPAATNALSSTPKIGGKSPYRHQYPGGSGGGGGNTVSASTTNGNAMGLSGATPRSDGSGGYGYGAGLGSSPAATAAAVATAMAGAASMGIGSGNGSGMGAPMMRRGGSAISNLGMGLSGGGGGATPGPTGLGIVGTDGMNGASLNNGGRPEIPLGLAMGMAGLNTPLMMARMGSSSSTNLTMGTPNMGIGLGLGLGMGMNMALSGDLEMRDPEAMRERKMAHIVLLLGQKWGFVTQDGVERCARRLGLECLWEDGGGVTGLAVSSGARTLSIAGQGMLVDVEFRDESRVQAVSLSFPGSGDGWGSTVDRGAEVLKNDLLGARDDTRKTIQGDDAVDSIDGNGYIDLAAFAEDLGALAKLDSLSREGVSCYDALEGIWEALRKIWEWENTNDKDDERQALYDRPDSKRKSEGDIGTNVICTGNGRPRMHEEGNIGLNWEYWMDRRFLAASLDTKSPPTDQTPSLALRPQTYTLNLDCEPFSAAMYPSIRISNHWLDEPIAKRDSLEDELLRIATARVPFDLINWLNPPLTYTRLPSANEDPHAMNIDTATQELLNQTLPNARFVARLRPPLVVPLTVAMQIADSVGHPIAQESMESTTYVSLLLPEAFPSQLHKANGQQQEEISSTMFESQLFEKVVRSYSPVDKESVRKHFFTLYVTSNEWGRVISDIPFSHPRQISAILPTLRQWALVGALLKRSFTGLGTKIVGRGESSLVDESPEQGKSFKTQRNMKGRHAQRRLKRLRRVYHTVLPDSDTASDTDSSGSSDPSDINLSFEDEDHSASTATSLSLSDGENAGSAHKIPHASAPRSAPLTPIYHDVLLNLDSMPRISITTATPKHSVAFQIELNGEVEVIDYENGTLTGPEEKQDGDVDMESGMDGQGRMTQLKKDEEERKIKRVVEVSEDLGVLGEWIARKR